MHYFNPHSREGSDQSEQQWGSRQKNFNPHSREGSDKYMAQGVGVGFISIHTPAKGVTQTALSDAVWDKISIHTPAKGVTL